MLDLKYIREKGKSVEDGAAAKGVTIDIQKVIAADDAYRALLQEVQKLREERNSAAKRRDIKQGKQIKDELAGKEEALKKADELLQRLLRQIPNPSKPDVKVGKNDTENDVIRTYKEPTKFSFTPKDHLALGETLDIIDTERAAKVSGARFTYLKNEAVLLELALIQYAMATLVKEGFTPVIPPYLLKRETMQDLGYLENGGEEDMFYLEKDDMFLIGTAEHSIASMFKNETLSAADLPRRFVGFSPAFRREAGSYGKDTKGILRLHQFDKAEMVSFVKKGEDDREHEYLLSLEERFFQALGIPYQVVKMCTGDLGFPAARKYDIEAWMPGQQKYREVTSVSTVTDFQSRRLNTKYRLEGETEYVQILNGTAFAMGRTLIAIFENYQQKDGSVAIPDVLVPYTGFSKIEPKK